MKFTTLLITAILASIGSALGVSTVFAAAADAKTGVSEAPAVTERSGTEIHEARPESGERQPIAPQLLESFVDGVVTTGMLALNVAGLEVAIVQAGQPVLLKGYGAASLDPSRRVDPGETLFRVGSISKIFTWILLMREVERGRISLDAPVNDYLPDDLQIPSPGFDEPVRFIHLMSHAPGFESRSTGEFVKDPGKVLSLHDRLKLQFPDRVFEPGLLSSYSDQGAELAGYVVAQLNGMDFESLAERDIFAPLGLKHTTFREPYPAREGLPAPMSQALAANVSTGFGWSGTDFHARPFEYTPAPSGSLSTTAADMARIMLLLLNDGSLDDVTLYGPSTAKAFQTQIMKVPEGVNGWAHGFIVYELPGGFEGYGHSGGMLSFLSNMVVIPELDLGVFVTTNTNTGWGLAERLPAAIVERFYAAPPESSRLKGDPALVRQGDIYAGRYIFTRRAYSGLDRFRYLLRSSGAVSITPDGYLLAAGQKWAPEGAAGRFRSLDRAHVLRFQFDRGGRALSYMDDSGTGTWQRAGLLLDKQLFLSLAGLTVLAALAKLAGLASGAGRTLPQTQWQRVSHVIGSITGVLWLVAVWAFATWATEDTLTRVYGWPGTRLLVGSGAALIASLASIALAVLLPFACRAHTGWSTWRKGRHAVMVVLFLLFAGMLAAWSALVPWHA